MKIWIMSDLHQEFPEYQWRPEQMPEHDVLVLAGDKSSPGVASIEYAEGMTDRPVVLIAGNHEAYGHVLDDMLRDIKERAAKARELITSQS